MQTDILLPRLSDIIARALDIRAIAVHRADVATVDQIDRLMTRLPFAGFRWELGALVVDSPSGGQYRITRAGCSCLNAQRSNKRQCWHVLLYELILDMFDTAVETADIDADMDDGPTAAELALAKLAERLEATAQILDTMRAAQHSDPPFEDNPLGDDEGDEQPARRLGVRLATARRRSAYFASAFYLGA